MGRGGRGAVRRGEGPGGILEIGEQEDMTSRAVAEAKWRRSSGSNLGSIGIWY